MQPFIRTEADRNPEFSAWATGVVGSENLRQCIHCGQCSASCPLARYMDYSPRRLMHLAREGFKDDVLGSFTIWLCTSCYECTEICPRNIKVTDVLYAFKRRAIEEGIYPKRFAIPVLAREFGKMIRRNGRISESRLVLKLMLKSNLLRLLGMFGIGMNLLKSRRFSLKKESIRGRKELRKMLDAVGHGEERAA